MAVKKKKHGAAIGVGIALAAASIAAAYFLSGKEGARRRREIKGWMVKAKGEVLEKMERAKEMNEKVYAQIVEEVSKRYRGAKQIDPKEMKAFVKEMRGYWRGIRKSLAPAPKRSTKKKS